MFRIIDKKKEQIIDENKITRDFFSENKKKERKRKKLGEGNQA